MKLHRPHRLVLIFLCLWPFFPFATPAIAAAMSQVVVGNARFTVITPNCIRLEYSGSAHFIDDPSYFAANRAAAWSGAKISSDDKSATIDTGIIHLTYTADGKPFNSANLQATVQKGDSMVTWNPQLPNSSNLGGTERTLDGWDGPRKISDGILSRNGWYLLDDSQSVLLTNDWAKPRPADAGTDWYLFGYGDDYRAALRSLTAISGNVPLPRRYAMGAWYSRYWPYSSQEFRQIVQQYADHHFPLDVLVMDMDWHLDGWTGYTWNPKLLPDHQDLLNWLHSRGLAVTLNDHPAEGVGPQESCYSDFMRAMGKGSAAQTRIPFDAGDQNYLETFWRFTHDPLLEQGVDFFWLDWQQFPYTRSIPGLTNLAWLNQFYFQQSGRDDRRGLSFSRWAGWGDQRHPIHFSGDASTSFKMLAAEIPFTSTAGNVGCFFWSHDIGGHNRGRNEESYTRWCQFGAFSAALRSHSTRDPNMDRRPWTYPSWAEDSMRASFQLRSRFFPYIYSAAAQACADSYPFIRPMYLDNPSAETAYHQPQEYLLGDNVLIAPIAEAGSGASHLARQTVWFPPGEWFNFFTNEQFHGEAQALVAAAIDEFPLYIRGGAAIPMRSFSQRMATDPLDELIIRAYPGADQQSTATTLYEDDGITTAYTTGAFAKTTLSYLRKNALTSIAISAAQGTFKGQPQMRSYVIELPALNPPRRVLINNTTVAFEYVSQDGLIRIKLPARSIKESVTITVDADLADQEIFKVNAFARRAGLATPAATEALPNLLSTALDKSKADGESAALCAAAGMGIYSRNENTFGYPQQTIARTFLPDDHSVKIEPLPARADDFDAVQSDSFRLALGGREFTIKTLPLPVDWALQPDNIAPAAKVQVSSGNFANGLVDGEPDGYPGDADHEWASKGEKANAWAQLTWPSLQTIHSVVLFDRPNLADQVTSGQIDFSDGSSLPFGLLENDASHGTVIHFPAKIVTSIKITVKAVSPTTVNSGLSEVVVLGQANSR